MSIKKLNTKILQPFLPANKIVDRIMNVFQNASIKNLYNVSDVQNLALTFAFQTIIGKVLQPLADELALKHDSQVKLVVCEFEIVPIVEPFTHKIRVLNTG
jgi:hypothetical protein